LSRYLADQNKVVHLFESGTYAGSISALGVGANTWLGEIQSFSIDQTENYLEDRYLGASSRNVQDFQQGPLDIAGTITSNIQDVNLLAHALGSTYEVVATNTRTTTATEFDSDACQNVFISGTGKEMTTPYSFTIEDSKQTPGTGANFIRTVRGCVVDTATLTLAQGEKTSIETGFMAQQIDHSSGTTTTIGSNILRPYLWSDSTLTLAGSTISTAKEISLEITNNLEAPHYLNGSRAIGQPFLGNRNYTLNVTMDADFPIQHRLYRTFFAGGSVFNAELDLDHDVTAVGSAHATIYMSGCIIATMDNPSEVEGINETTLEIRPKTCNLISYDSKDYAGSANPY